MMRTPAPGVAAVHQALCWAFYLTGSCSPVGTWGVGQSPSNRQEGNEGTDQRSELPRVMQIPGPMHLS